eukprot:COSAG04_NODE_4364_length_2136_cov_0.889107_2_plen_302_part_00
MMAMMSTHEWARCMCAGPEARLAFLQDGSAKLLTERTPDDEAGLVLRCEMAAVLLEQAELKEAKKIVEEIGEKLDAMFGCENRTYSTYHKTAALYHRAMGDAEAYYLAALQFLGYVDINDLPPAERHSWAFEIGTSLPPTPSLSQPLLSNRYSHACVRGVVVTGKAALLGEKVFNFGELLVHPVIESLAGSAEAWVVALLQAFNSGDVGAYRSVTAEHGAAIGAQVRPSLRSAPPNSFCNDDDDKGGKAWIWVCQKWTRRTNSSPGRVGCLAGGAGGGSAGVGAEDRDPCAHDAHLQPRGG